MDNNTWELLEVNQDFLVSINEKEISTDFNLIHVLKEKRSYLVKLIATSQNGERINVSEEFILKGNLIFFSDTILTIRGPAISSQVS